MRGLNLVCSSDKEVKLIIIIIMQGTCMSNSIPSVTLPSSDRGVKII